MSKDPLGSEPPGGYPSVGSFVRAVRLRAGLTGQQLADKIRHSLTWLYRLEVGDRAVPEQATLQAISDACGLSEWESCYLFGLAGLAPPLSGVADRTLWELAEQSLEPMGWSEDHIRFYYNPEARRLFKGIEEYPTLSQWLWRCPDAARVLINWDGVADWLTSASKIYFMKSQRDPVTDARVAIDLAELPDFRRRWRASSIPLDPASFVVHVCDSDKRLDRTIDIRFWTHPYRKGLFGTGNTIRTNPHDGESTAR